MDCYTADSQHSLKDDFGLVIARWETLRLFFNAALIATCIVYTACASPANFGDFEFWKYLVAGAVLSNVLFMTGPALDGYLTWYGVWTAPIAMLLFGAGTLLTSSLAIGWIGRY
jgi:hypothetical protein